MVYFAAGISGMTAIVGTFFVKEYLGLSATFLAELAFWAGLPWALKMPIGHLVDLLWRYKSLFVYFGAMLIAASLAIMFGLIVHTGAMTQVMGIEAWYVLSILLAPVGYVIQDVVADAMTVEAVPLSDAEGQAYKDSQIKAMHTTMQMLGRFAIISGTIAVALLNITMFAGIEAMTAADRAAIYADIYLISLTIPIISVIGVTLGGIFLLRRKHHLLQLGYGAAEIVTMVFEQGEANAAELLDNRRQFNIRGFQPDYGIR